MHALVYVCMHARVYACKLLCASNSISKRGMAEDDDDGDWRLAEDDDDGDWRLTMRMVEV